MPPCDTIYRRRLAPKKKPRSEAGLSTMTSGEGRPPRRHFNARMSVRFQPLTTLTAGRPNLRTSSGPSGSGGARLGPSQKDGLPHRCWDRHWRFKAIDSRVTSPLRENIPRPQRAQIALVVKSCGQFAERPGKEIPSRLAGGWGSLVSSDRGCHARRAIVAHRRLAIGKEEPRG